MYAYILLITTSTLSVYSLDLYTSTAQVKESLQFISKLRTTTGIENYLDSKEKQLDQIEKIVDSLKELSEESTDPFFDLEHPLNVFRFIRNHSLVYNQTVERLFRAIDNFEKGTFNVTQLQSVLKKLPTQGDLDGIIDGIFRIQEVYDLPADDLIYGKSTFGLRDTLTAKQCQYIGKRALALEKHFYARDWIHLAYYMVKMKKDSTVPLDQLLEDASEVAFAAGNVKEALEIAEHLMDKNPSDRKFRKLYKKYKSKYDSMTVGQQTLSGKYGREPPSRSEKEENFNILCRGKGEMLKQKHGLKKEKLSCWFQDNGHPSLLFQPGKLEQVSKNPYLVIYHDFLAEKDIKNLKDYALPRLKRLGLMNKKGVFVNNESRISKTSLISRHKIKDRIQKRIEALTTTSRSGYEILQVTNYGFGGWYTEHTDHFPQRVVAKGIQQQRHSTFMIYMSDVQAGGATVFTRLYETIYPEAGKALFWHNTFRNGTGNSRARHGACPVLAGDKWILNQWILQEGQEFLRPCSLNNLE